MIGVLAALVGCEAVPMPTGPAPEDPPEDFSLAVTVFDPIHAGEHPSPPLTPARYILDPDGALRAAVGAGASPTTFPPIVRRLSEGQRQRVWWLTLATGAHEPGPGERIDSPETYRPASDDPEALITVAWLGGRASVVRTLGEGEPGRALTAELARLSWVER